MVQLICLKQKEHSVVRVLSLSIIFLSIATFIAGLIAHSPTSFLWLVIAAIYIAKYIQLKPED